MNMWTLRARVWAFILKSLVFTFRHAAVSVRQDDPGHGSVALYPVHHTRSVIHAVQMPVKRHQLGQLHAAALLRQMTLQNHRLRIPLHGHAVPAAGHQQTASFQKAEPRVVLLAAWVRVQVRYDCDPVTDPAGRVFRWTERVRVVISDVQRCSLEEHKVHRLQILPVKNMTLEHKTGIFGSNSQLYIVWVKIIIFILCQKSLGYYDYVPWRYFVP